MIKWKEEEYYFRKMIQFLLVNGLKILQMVQEFILVKKIQFTLGNGRMENCKIYALFKVKLMFMKVSLRMVFDVALGNKHG